MSQQLELFASATLPARINPFSKVQGVNLFGTCATFTCFCPCTGGDIVRAAYAGAV